MSQKALESKRQQRVNKNEIMGTHSHRQASDVTWANKLWREVRYVISNAVSSVPVAVSVPSDNV